MAIHKTTDTCNLNPRAKLTVWDIGATLIVLTIYAPLSILASLCHKRGLFQWKTTKEQVSHDLLMCLGRHLPVSVIQRASDQGGSVLRQSLRYAHAPFQVAQKVERSDFAGYWVYRDMSVETRLQNTDLVLFHVHGGGYVMGHPLENAPELLLIAETLTQRNHTVAIFSLEYTLAPNAPFPTQLAQITAAYTWLTTELHTNPSKLYLISESAGGHLMLSLLTTLHHRSLRTEKSAAVSATLPKPAAVFMISPWVNLTPCGPDARAKPQDLDRRNVAFKRVLERFSLLVMQGVPREYEEAYSNFAVEASERGSWRDILPAKTWVSSGTAEPLFRFDVEGFVGAARRDGADVSFELAEGGEHVWQSVEAREQEREFLALALGGDNTDLMPGYRHVAEMTCSLLEIAESDKHSDARRGDAR